MNSIFMVTLLIGALSTSSAQNVIVWNSHLFDNGREFYVRGVDYSPGIIGQCTTNFVTGFGGTGFCSAKLTPYNEYKSACYDSDYFDGKPWPQNTSINGFQLLWERDFPLIKQYGANLVRVYNCNPSTLAATQTYKNIFPLPNGKDHTLFMQTAVKYDLRVAFPLYMANADFPSLNQQQFTRYLRWQIDEVGNSPALLYWVLGNEQAWTWSSSAVADSSVVAKYNLYTDYAKRYTYSKWGRWIPISLSTHNSPYDAAVLMPYLHLDFYSENYFTVSNTDYDNKMVNGITDQGVWFEGYKNLTCKYTKPFLITEFGRTYTIGRTYVAGDIPLIMYNIYRYARFGLLGGIYYEATDEPYAPDVNKQAYNFIFNNFGVSSISITPASNGRCNSNASNCFIPDTATIKSPQYNDITSGTYNGKNYGYLASIQSVLGRELYTIDNVPDYCTGYRQCPNANPNMPMCSGNGMCNRITGVCACGSGWSGSDCSVASCPNNCNGRGSCSSLVTPPECFCNPGYYGSSCQLTVANRAANACPGVNNCTYGNGVCNGTTWTCQCWPGWTGMDCAVTDLNGLGSRTSSSSATISLTSSASVGTTSSSATVAASTTSAVASTSSVSTTSAASTSSASASSAATTLAGSSTSSATISAATTSSVASTSATASVATTSSNVVTSSGSVSASTSNNAVTTSNAVTSSSLTSTGATTAAAASTNAASTSSVSSTAVAASRSTSSATVASSTSAATSVSTSATSAVSTTSTISSAATTSTVSTSASVASTTTTATTSGATSTASSTSSASTATVATSSTTATRATTVATSTTASTTATSETAVSSSSTVGRTQASSSTTGATTSSPSLVSASSSTSSTGRSTTASTGTATSTQATSTSVSSSSSTSSSTASTASSTTASSSSSQTRSTSSSTGVSSTSSQTTASSSTTATTATAVASTSTLSSTRSSTSSVSTATSSRATSSTTAAVSSSTLLTASWLLIISASTLLL